MPSSIDRRRAASGQFTGLVEGTDWLGNFTVGNNVLYTGDPNNPFAAASSFTVNLNTAVAGLGLQITSNFYGAFTASLEVFNGATSLGVNRLLTTDTAANGRVVPEPGTLSLLTIGAGTAMWRRRRARSRREVPPICSP